MKKSVDTDQSVLYGIGTRTVVFLLAKNKILLKKIRLGILCSIQIAYKQYFTLYVRY